ncbi:hypothetical protein MMC18_006044 [Xylographa bjoerkii]|nr:hypothetical protein [Xylographa bjoerkii]
MSDPANRPDPRPPAPSPNSFASATHALSLTLLVAAPLLVALPPRKLDLYTFSLSSAWLVSANHLTTERTGASLVGHLSQRLGRGDGLPSARAREVQARLRAEKERARMGDEERARRLGRDGQALSAAVQTGQIPQEGPEQREQGGILGAAEKLWMGGEEEGWKARRLREEQEALAEGKGYWDLIAEQVWEVWNWGRKDGEGYGYGHHGGDVEAEKRRVEELKREKSRGLGGE